MHAALSRAAHADVAGQNFGAPHGDIYARGRAGSHHVICFDRHAIIPNVDVTVLDAVANVGLTAKDAALLLARIVVVINVAALAVESAILIFVATIPPSPKLF